MIYDEKSFLFDGAEFPGIQKQLIDALSAPVFLRKPDGDLLLANKAFCEMTGCGEVIVQGKKISDFMDERQADLLERYDQDVLNDKENHRYEVLIRNSAAVFSEYLVEKSLLYNEKQELVGILSVLTDLSEQRKAERGMKAALEASEMALAMLHKIRAGIVIVDSDWHVINSNPGFAQLIGGDIVDLFDSVPGLKGANLKELVPEAIYRMFVSIMNSGEASLERDLRYQNKLLHVSVITIYKNRVVGALIRDMSTPALVREEIVSRAQRVNKQNMETVQKIAFLLGENASVMEELLHSIIESYSYGEEDKA